MKKIYKKIIIIQTAFIGDVILATGVIEKLHTHYPEAKISLLLRKGNEHLFHQHPFLEKIFIWNKQKSKHKNLWSLLWQIRKEKFDLLINLQRFFSSGLLMIFSGAKEKICFDKNPLAWLADSNAKHTIAPQMHEIDRNQELIKNITDNQASKPKLYPTEQDYKMVQPYTTKSYICIAPTSVWFTKQFPAHKWVEFLRQLPREMNVYLLGAKSDENLCQEILEKVENPFVHNLAGKLSLLASAALMKNALMNYANDSAPLHLASSLNAPICAIYCSTSPEFGFYPVSDISFIVETQQKLDCRPCGLHGYKSCPQGHFSCAESIDTQRLVALVQQ
ncbi:MAG: glycosyltransferase family 9 protein [Cytophagales bacterium]|nr:glycosyltransferase family 9 protein [Cytophagales bacterium]